VSLLFFVKVLEVRRNKKQKVSSIGNLQCIEEGLKCVNPLVLLSTNDTLEKASHLVFFFFLQTNFFDTWRVGELNGFVGCIHCGPHKPQHRA
jgi:hypothetical protein